MIQNGQYIVKAYQCENDPEMAKRFNIESKRNMIYYIRQRNSKIYTYIHSIRADFWNMVSNVNIEESMSMLDHRHHNLSVMTTPYLEKLVKDKILIPIHATEKEHKIQAALGLTYRWGREYKYIGKGQNV